METVDEATLGLFQDIVPVFPKDLIITKFGMPVWLG